ncbi:DEAD/DEAH box helicase [Bacillus sp. B-jedd]|uniref:DEAD/DEAH box helicase n=1 Tax=Bacillus sp. B-jedd TaxID=1476857 RepID=UPI0005155583|nr:DEAD/DEAH box helicase [Bacillus sp. B-jedd]CEG26554.1 putative helicase [Bacillus sp. B-jedd]
MAIKMNQKIIKDRCGPVSYKRGEAYFRAGKVTFWEVSDRQWTAVVNGAEDFSVKVVETPTGDIHTECTCPSLASVDKDCQHVAAVLLAIAEANRPGFAIPANQTEKNKDEHLTELFNKQVKRPSACQLHFETRQVMPLGFVCRPTSVTGNETMLGIEIEINSTPVKKIRGFLESVREGKPSTQDQYNPNLHCFEREADDVLQLLLTILDDENALKKTVKDSGDSHQKEEGRILVIPPSAFPQLLTLLMKAPLAKLACKGAAINGICISGGPLPLQIDLSQSKDGNYELKIAGLEKILLLESYRAVITEGKFVQLSKDDCLRLIELKRVLGASNSGTVPVPQSQAGIFLQKVVPGLRNLGIVRMSDSLAGEHQSTPLVAKLYLDRVKNRLLAGLEFHYGNEVINPLESANTAYRAGIFRETLKEEAILEVMEEGSFAKTEGGYFLHNEELEYEFLYHTIPKLEKLVQIYATTAVRNRIFKEPQPPRISVKVKKERTNWLEFSFELKGINQQEIREVLAALEEKRKYYRLKSGALMSLETREFEEIQRFLKAAPVQIEDWEAPLNLPLIDGLRLIDSAGDGNAFSFEESFRNFLEEIHNPLLKSFEIPSAIEPVMRNYQKQGFQWLKTLASYGFGGLLADDMGLGKTMQSIAYILSELPEIRRQGLPALVVCPSSVTYNWLNEFMKFAPEINAVVADGDKVERRALMKELSGIDVLITSYPLIRKDIHSYESQAFHCVFFDEAQAFKNPVTQTARAVKKIRAPHRFALTGTPIENSIEELWSIFHVVFPGLFKGLREYSHLTTKQIARRVRPFMLRRLKKDVLSELPAKIESVNTAELLPDQKKLYAAYLAKLRLKTLKHLDKQTIRKNRIKILAGITRLRQICCHPALFVDGYKGSSAKFEQLLQLVEESKQAGRRVLVFSQFTKMLDIIGKGLSERGIPFFYLDGQTPSEERVKVCERFNGGERDFFLISLKAGGTGLNLAGADTVILYDLWWNPAVEEQAADRAYRMGQENTVQVIKLVSRGTIEEKINELQDKKRRLADDLTGDGEGKSMSALTEEDIREILSD